MRRSGAVRWAAVALATTGLVACGSSGKKATAGDGAATTTSAKASTSTTTKQVAKATPAPGTGNVQGLVRFDDQPAAGVDVKLCETFERFVGGCSGATFKAVTEADGSYVIKDVPPKTYQGLLVRVFDTDDYVFASSGIVGAQSYEVTADKTLFVETTNLFKSDLKLTSPPAGGSVPGGQLVLSWEAYPNAKSYKVSMYNNDTTVINADLPTSERVDGTSYTIPKPVPAGSYRWQVEAYNGNGRKLAESPDDVKFTVTPG